MQNSMVIFNFFVFDWNYPFGGNLVQKNQICLFKLNFGTQTNSNMQNSMMRFILSATDLKYHFTVNLVQKILCLNWIWYLDYFEYAEFNGMVHLICLDWKYFFWANSVRKIKIVSLSWILVIRHIPNTWFQS